MQQIQQRALSTLSFFNGWRSTPGTIPATSQHDWLISMTAMRVPSGSKAMRHRLRSFNFCMGDLQSVHISVNGCNILAAVPIASSSGISLGDVLRLPKRHPACRCEGKRSTAERITFRQINKATGNRLRQQLIDEETREPVAPEHKGRGYEIAKGQYLVIDDAELEAIEIESTHTIEIDSFVPRTEIDQRFSLHSGVLWPNWNGDRADASSPFSLFRTSPEGQSSLYMVGCYQDRLVRRADGFLAHDLGGAVLADIMKAAHTAIVAAHDQDGFARDTDAAEIS
jgi:hypothetical protein